MANKKCSVATTKKQIKRPVQHKCPSKKQPKSLKKKLIGLQKCAQTQLYLKKRFHQPHKRKKEPTEQRVWRKTIARPKPKKELPKMFRLDRTTGLPMDYERTAEFVMHYVNPHLTPKPNTEQLMVRLLTDIVANEMGISVPGMAQHALKHEMKKAQTKAKFSKLDAVPKPQQFPWAAVEDAKRTAREYIGKRNYITALMALQKCHSNSSSRLKSR